MTGPRAYTAGTRAALASLADGSCYYPGCSAPIVVFVNGDPYNNAEIAHIRDARPGNRFDPGMTDAERAHFRNLILLCRPHHQLVDKIRPSDFSSEILQEWKRTREEAWPSGPSAMHRESWPPDALVRLATLALPLEPEFPEMLPGGQLTPYQALWPKFGLVPFRDHSRILEHLEQWCDSLEQSSAIFLDGTGGSGKTRTAVELCRRRQAKGWLAGFYRDDTLAPALALGAQDADKLIVFDYANDRPNEIRLFLEEIVSAESLGKHRLRFVLITRDGAAARPMSSLFAHQTRSTALLDAAETFSLGTDSHPFDYPARWDLFHSARDSFTAQFGISTPGIEDVPDLAPETYSSPLFVVFSALLSTYRDQRPTAVTRDEILERILSREAELFWDDCPEPDPELRDAIVCTATIGAASTEQQILDRLHSIGYRSGDIMTRRIASWLRTLYPGPHWANGLEPDLLGEYLIRERVPAGLASHITTQGDAREASSMLRVIERVLAQSPATDMRGSLREVLDALPAVLPAWLERERQGDVAFSDTLDSAAAVLERLTARFPLGTVDIPGRLGPAGQRLAVRIAQKRFDDADSEGQRWLLGVELAGRLVSANRGDEARPLIDEFLDDMRADRKDLEHAESTIRLNLWRSRISASATKGALPALEAATDLLGQLDRGEREKLIGLDAAVQQQLATVFLSISRFPSADRALNRAVALRRQAVARLGEAHAPALAASLRSRAKHEYKRGTIGTATDDIIEAIEILKDHSDHPSGIFQGDLARCYDVAALIMKSQDVTLAESYTREALRAHARLADVFGADARLDLLSAVTRAGLRHPADRAYVEEAMQIMSSITLEEKLSTDQVIRIIEVGQQLATIDPSETLARDIGAALRTLPNVPDYPIEIPGAPGLKNATKLARTGDLEESLLQYRNVRRLEGDLPSSQYIQRLAPYLTLASKVPNSNSFLLELDSLAVDLGRVLATHDSWPRLKPRSMLTAMYFVHGWLSEASGHEELLEQIQRAVQSRVSDLIRAGQIQDHTAGRIKSLTQRRGRMARRRASGPSSTLPGPSTAKVSTLRNSSPRRLSSRPLADDDRLRALRDALASDDTGQA